MVRDEACKGGEEEGSRQGGVTSGVDAFPEEEEERGKNF